MRIFVLLTLIILLVPYKAWSGDYMLTISDNQNAACTERARKIHEWCAEERAKGNKCIAEQSWPIHTADEVIASLQLYFANKEPTIKILLGAFSNGHLDFCTNVERMKIYNALQEIKKSGKATKKRHLDDFIKILGIKEK